MKRKKMEKNKKSKYEQPFMIKLGEAVWKGTISFIVVLVFGFLFINFISMITQHKDALTVWEEFNEFRNEFSESQEGATKILSSDIVYYKFINIVLALCWIQQVWFWYPAKYKQYQI